MALRWERMVVGPFLSNSYVLLDMETGEGIIIDPGAEGKKILKVAEDIGVIRLLYVVNTHGHIDHIGANHEVILNETRLLIHRKDASMLKAPYLNLSIFLEKSYVSPEPSKLLEEGDLISVGRYEFSVIHLPGHTPGSIALYGEGLLFVGDTLFVDGVGRTDFPGGSEKDLFNSIHKKILPLPNNILVLPGHGDYGELGYIKTHNPFLR